MRQELGAMLHTGRYVVRIARAAAPSFAADGEFHFAFHHKAPLFAVTVRRNCLAGVISKNTTWWSSA